MIDNKYINKAADDSKKSFTEEELSYLIGDGEKSLHIMLEFLSKTQARLALKRAVGAIPQGEGKDRTDYRDKDLRVLAQIHILGDVMDSLSKPNLSSLYGAIHKKKQEKLDKKKREKLDKDNNKGL